MKASSVKLLVRLLISILTLVFVAYPTSAQYHPTKGQSREDFLAETIQNLEQAKTEADTAIIIHSLMVLAINFQSARMHERSRDYLKEGIAYALAFESDSLTSKLANMAGYSLLIQMGDTSNLFYNTARDSALWWFKKQSELAEKVYGGMSSELGWGYRGIIYVYNKEARDNKKFHDSAAYYYNKASLIWDNDSDLEFDTRQIYGWYLLLHGKYEEAKIVLSEIQHLDYEPYIKQRHAYYSTLLKLLSAEAGLDTLGTLYDSALTTFTQVVASTHEDKLYENDQKYKVSKTKEVLGKTEAELFASRRLLIISIAGIIIFLALSVYLYLLFQKNKKLRDLNANLVKEQNHRVKNNLQMLASMIAVQAEKVEDETVRQNLLDNEKRIQSLALLHRRLYDREYIKVDVKEYFEELVEEVLFSLSSQYVKATFAIDKISLPVDTMVHLGLITNELVTNSVKHGFDRHSANPEINISFKRSDRTHSFMYQDNGRGSGDNVAEGFGTDLIKSQVKQLGGTFTIENKNGYNLVIEF